MKANQEVIDTLKKVLKSAEAGEVKGIAMITLEPRRVIGQAIAGDISKFDAIAGVEVLKRDLMDGVERLKDHYPAEFEEVLG